MTKYAIIFWIVCGLGAAGFINAKNDHFNWGQEKCKIWAARDQSFSLIWGILGGPISLGISLAMTGFGYEGWQITRKVCIDGQT